MAKKPITEPSALPSGLTLTIPGQGDYLQSMSKHQSAYEKAVAQLTAQRRQQQYLSGLNDKWQVDPTQQYGAYQQMLQSQGGNLMAAHDASAERGLFGGGLANQAESGLRYGQAVEQLGFRNQLSDWENQYNQGMASAKQQQAEDDLYAQQQAAANAYNNEDYTPYYDQTQPDQPQQPENPWNPNPTTNVAPGTTKGPPKPGRIPTRPISPYEHGRGRPPARTPVRVRPGGAGGVALGRL